MRMGVLGCAGRMGRAVIGEVLAAEDCTLVGGVDRDDHPALGQDLGLLTVNESLGVVLSTDAAGLIAFCLEVAN